MITMKTLTAALAAGVLALLPAGVVSAADAGSGTATTAATSEETAPPLGGVPGAADADPVPGLAITDFGGEIGMMRGAAEFVGIVCDPDAGVGREAWVLKSNRGQTTGQPLWPAVEDADAAPPIEYAAYTTDGLLVARSGCLTDGERPAWGSLSGVEIYEPTEADVHPDGDLGILPGQPDTGNPKTLYEVEQAEQAAAAKKSAAAEAAEQAALPTASARENGVIVYTYPGGERAGVLLARGQVVRLLGENPVEHADHVFWRVSVDGEPAGWVRAQTLVGAPDIAPVSDGTPGSALLQQGESGPGIQSHDRGRGPALTSSSTGGSGWAWLAVPAALALLWMWKRVRADERDASEPGTLLDGAATVLALPAVVGLVLLVPGSGSIWAYGVALVATVSAGLLWVRRRAINRGIVLQAADQLRTLTANPRRSAVIAGTVAAGGAVGALAGAWGWSAIPAGLLLALLGWMMASGSRSLQAARKGLADRQALQQQLCAVLAVSPAVIEQTPVTIEPGQIKIQTPPATALKLGDVPGRVATVMPEWKIAVADHAQIVLTPVADDVAEQTRRAHAAASDGLVTEVTTAGTPNTTPVDSALAGGQVVITATDLGED